MQSACYCCIAAALSFSLVDICVARIFHCLFAMLNRSHLHHEVSLRLLYRISAVTAFHLIDPCVARVYIIPPPRCVQNHALSVRLLYSISAVSAIHLIDPSVAWVYVIQSQNMKTEVFHEMAHTRKNYIHLSAMHSAFAGPKR